ncbi:hypothetical protein ACFL6Y_06435, partial [Elusimicrobiota bacterium]
MKKNALKFVFSAAIAMSVVALPGMRHHHVFAATPESDASSYRKLTDKALLELGINPDAIPQGTLYNPTENKLTDMGPLLLEDSERAHAVRATWKNLYAIGMDPFMIRTGLLCEPATMVEFKRQIKTYPIISPFVVYRAPVDKVNLRNVYTNTPFVEYIGNTWKSQPGAAGKAINVFNNAYAEYEKLRMNAGEVPVTLSGVARIFNALDRLEKEDPGSFLAVEWLKKTIAPGGATLTSGIMDKKGNMALDTWNGNPIARGFNYDPETTGPGWKFDPTTVTLDDGRRAYIEFDSGIPIRIAVSDGQNWAYYNSGFDKYGHPAPPGPGEKVVESRDGYPELVQEEIPKKTAELFNTMGLSDVL